MDYPFHKSARTSLRILAILRFMIVVSIPLGIWVLWRSGRRIRRSSERAPLDNHHGRRILREV